MMPGPYPFDLYTGDYWSKEFQLGTQQGEDETTFEPLDLTGCTVTAVVKLNRRKTDIYAEMVCSIASPPTDGRVKVELMEEESAKILKNCVWDLQVVGADEHAQTWLTGAITVTRDVTPAAGG